MPLISEHYTSKLFNMANGSNCNNETCELVSSVCRIQSVVPHLPAKALLLNIKQYNGKFGCSTCKHPGRYSHSARQIRARLYKYWPSGTVAVRAAHETRMLLLIMNMISNYFQLAVSVFHTQSSNVIWTICPNLIF